MSLDISDLDALEYDPVLKMWWHLLWIFFKLAED